MGQGPYAAGRVDANVDAAAAVDRALGVCASVMMPVVSDMRASSAEVPRAFGRRGMAEMIRIQNVKGKVWRWGALELGLGWGR